MTATILCMPTGPKRYPNFSEKLDHTDPFYNVQKLHGAGSHEALFPESGSSKVVAPWPMAGRTKGKPMFDQSKVVQALSQPRRTESMDPRTLHATQPWVHEEGVRYYMNNPEYQKTGRTFADQGNVGNRTPVVYSDAAGRNLILSGHHRATSALLKGGQFEAIHVKENE